MSLNQIKQLAVIIVILFSFQGLFSNRNKKYKVLDTLDSFPIGSASVYIKNTTIGTVTNIDGNFVLQVPQKACKRYSYHVSSIGYSTFKVPINEFDANSQDIYLKEEVSFVR